MLALFTLTACIRHAACTNAIPKTDQHRCSWPAIGRAHEQTLFANPVSVHAHCPPLVWACLETVRRPIVAVVNRMNKQPQTSDPTNFILWCRKRVSSWWVYRLKKKVFHQFFWWRHRHVTWPRPRSGVSAVLADVADARSLKVGLQLHGPRKYREPGVGTPMPRAKLEYASAFCLNFEA